MAVSAGADVAIIIGVVALLFAAAIGAFMAKKAYKRRQERQHARLASRELDLDFDTTDVEFAPGRKATRGHGRVWSNSSADSSRPLMKGEMGWSTPSERSFDSDIHPVSTLAYANPRSPPPPVVPLKSSAPTPPPKDRQLPLQSADHDLGNLISRPSFLTRPRQPPRPGEPKRTRSRDMRTNLLTRLASGRTGRRARSADGRDDDSPSSLYSQASEFAGGYWELEGDVPVNRGEPIPPVPPLPQRFQDQTSTVRSLPPLPPIKPELPASHVGGWRPDMDANNTLDSNPFNSAHGQSASRLSLEDSLAFPLPLPTGLSLISPKSPHRGWFSDKMASDSPTSSSPSPKTAYVYTSHFPEPRIPSLPAEAVKALPAQDGDVMNVRMVEASRDVPKFNIVNPHYSSSCESGMVGYQVPTSWPPSPGAQEQSAKIASFVAQ